MNKIQFPLNAIPIEPNSHCIKIRYSIEPRERRYVKTMNFYLLLKTLVKI